jgi:predicted branched-subunit amino acid permease
VNCAYLWSAFILADLMWAGGTLCGILAGNILPARVVTALSVAIYGMFLAIIIPPTRKNRVLAGLVAAAFACSFAANRLIPSLSEGTRTVILTVGLAAVAAVLFPVKDDDTSAKGEGKEETA